MNTTPILPVAAARCRPAEHCARRHRCVRFQAELMAGAPLQTVGCPGFIDAADHHNPQAAPKAAKPYPGGTFA